MSRTDFGEELSLEIAEDAGFALLGRYVADRLLQREHRLRALERGETKAPIDDLEHVFRILSRPDVVGRDEVIFLQPSVGRRRRERGEAGEHAGPDAVHV